MQWLQGAVTCGPFIRPCHIRQGQGVARNSPSQDPASRGKSSGGRNSYSLGASFWGRAPGGYIEDKEGLSGGSSC